MSLRCRIDKIKTPIKPWFYGRCLNLASLCLAAFAEGGGFEPTHKTCSYIAL